MEDESHKELILITGSPGKPEDPCLHLVKKRGICAKCGYRAQGRPKSSHQLHRTKRKRWKLVNGSMTATVFGENMENCSHDSVLKGICNNCGKNTTGY